MNTKKLFALERQATEINEEIIEQKQKLKEMENNLAEVENKIKSLLPQKTWYAYDINRFSHTNQYRVQKVKSNSSRVRVVVREVDDKIPYPLLEHFDFTLDEFTKLNISKSEEKAKDLYAHRICPRCGGFMGMSRYKWCPNCMKERAAIEQEYNDSHRFYDPEQQRFYTVKYVDELTRDFGFDRFEFTLRRLDTGEIIQTNNLWSDGYGENTDGLPEIEFIDSKNKEKGKYVSDVIRW